MQTTSNRQVLLITPFYHCQRGNSITAIRLRAGLIKKGWQVDLLSLDSRDWPEQIRTSLARHHYALIHGLHARHLAQVVATLPEIKSFPLVLTTTGTDINFDLPEKQESILPLLQAVQAIVVFNADFQLQLAAAFPELKQQIYTIPQGILLEEGPGRTRQELGWPSEHIVFLLPSGIRPVKDLDLAINGLAKLYQEIPRLHLTIMGAVIDPGYYKSIARRIQELPWVTYLGEIPHQEMRGILSLGDVVLNTSLAEGQPQAALEAMSLGKPAILRAVPGNLNIITPGKEGFYIHSEAQLTEAARQLIIKPELRWQMGEEARHLVETSFTLEKEIDAYHRLYLKIFNNPMPRD